jgi:hypothetical protein
LRAMHGQPVVMLGERQYECIGDALEPDAALR